MEAQIETSDIACSNQSDCSFAFSADRSCMAHLLLFDLSIYGHHPSYIRHLIKFANYSDNSQKLSIVVSQKFLAEHADVVEFGQYAEHIQVEFVAITTKEEDSLVSRRNGFSRNWRNFQEWRIFCRYAKTLQVDQALVMYFDTYQIPIALGFTPPCPTSGIYFRPTFHYPYLLSNQIEQNRDAQSNYVQTHYPNTYNLQILKQKLQRSWERLLLDRVLHSFNFGTLFSLDPFVGEYIKNIPSTGSVVHLPDPVQLEVASDDIDSQIVPLRQHLEIEPGRQIFLMFGALTARKGIYRVLDAISHLTQADCKQICLLLVGEADESNRSQIDRQVGQLCRDHAVQIIRQYKFIADDEIPSYFHLSDVVLATYQRHVGMSGILIWAAATQKPVLGSDYGLMGELVRRYQLGLAIDSTQSEAIARGLHQYLENSPEIKSKIDPEKMQQFAEQNSAQAYAKTIYQSLTPTQSRM